ncbi:MAG TPA: hypothetical protein PL054_08950 [Clostridia bacterium]|nr:hypothetical protein [Clostridia bacterium]
MSQLENPNDENTKKEKIGLIKKIFSSEDNKVPDDSDYQSLLRKNFYNYDQVSKKRQLASLRITTMVLTVILIVILSLYIVHINDSTLLLDKLIESSREYVYENVMYVDNSIIYTEVTSELNVMRTLMNHNGETGKRQYAISELYYISIQLPNAFISHRADVYEAFKNLEEGRLEVGYKLIEELLVKIVEERK